MKKMRAMWQTFRTDVDRRVRTTRMLGLLFLAGGFVVIAKAWDGASNHVRVDSQFPYLLSGGFMGIGLIVTGCLLLVLASMRSERQAQSKQFDDMATLLSRTLGRMSAPPGPPLPSRSRSSPEATPTTWPVAGSSKASPTCLQSRCVRRPPKASPRAAHVTRPASPRSPSRTRTSRSASPPGLRPTPALELCCRPGLDVLHLPLEAPGAIPVPVLVPRLAIRLDVANERVLPPNLDLPLAPRAGVERVGDRERQNDGIAVEILAHQAVPPRRSAPLVSHRVTLVGACCDREFPQQFTPDKAR